MSSKNWKLKSSKDVVTRTGRKCSDCDNAILTGSFARVKTFTKRDLVEAGDAEVTHFRKDHICEECEKYHRRGK